jgi:hypothetical protein
MPRTSPMSARVLIDDTAFHPDRAQLDVAELNALGAKSSFRCAHERNTRLIFRLLMIGVSRSLPS